MAPGTRRANRGAYAEHDDFEGLPVRQWRQEWADAAPPVQAEPTRKDDIWSVELRWGMPRDTGLLASHSQELLRAARSGRLYKRPSPAEEEEAEVDTTEKPDKKEDDTATKGFQVKVWKQITRNTDDSTISHLAKRRKGIVTISSKTVVAQPSGATVTRATVRRTDAAGNPYTQEITLQDGQAVDGEIISTTVVPLAAVTEQAQPTPPRNRRPPPPKKNKKLGGPGRGRKKKMVPLPAPVPGQEGAAPVEGAAAAPKSEPAEGENIVKQEREDSNNPDSEMADNDDDDGDDDGDDGDEGEGEEGDDNGEDQDQEMTDASPSIVQPSADTTMEMSGMESPLASKSQAPLNPLLAPPPNPSLSISSPKLEGSPLKNVILPSPTEPSQTQAPAATTSQPTEEAQAPETKAEASPGAAVQPTVEQPAMEKPAVEPPAADQTAPAQQPAADQHPAEQPTAESAAAEQTVSRSPERERTPVVEMDVTITDAATFIPAPEQVGDIKSPEAEAKSLETKSPEIKSPEAEAKSPGIKSPEPPASEAKLPEPAAADPVDDMDVTMEVEQTETPRPAAEDVVAQVEGDSTIPAAPVVDDVKESSPAQSVPSHVPAELKEEVAEPLVSPPKTETVPAEPLAEPAPEPAADPSPPAPTVEEVPPSDHKPKSPTPAAAEEGPDLLAGLENALGQEHEKDQGDEHPKVELAASEEAPETEVKEEAEAEVKEEAKDGTPKPEEAAPPKDGSDLPAPVAEPADAGPP